MMRRRLGWWMLVAVLVAGCAASDAHNPPPTTDQTDVRFMQHMVGHLRQTTSITLVTRDRIRHPELKRLADEINQRGQAHLTQLQEWLDHRGLPPYDPQQDGNRKHADLARLTQARGTAFDLAFLKVITARHQAGSRLAATEARTGSLPEVRQLAQQLLTEQQAQVAKMTTWTRAWSKTGTKPSGG
jgi:uncharacterized protein (DUF305 family)